MRFCNPPRPRFLQKRLDNRKVTPVPFFSRGFIEIDRRSQYLSLFSTSEIVTHDIFQYACSSAIAQVLGSDHFAIFSGPL